MGELSVWEGTTGGLPGVISWLLGHAIVAVMFIGIPIALLWWVIAVSPEELRFAREQLRKLLGKRD